MRIIAQLRPAHRCACFCRHRRYRLAPAGGLPSRLRAATDTRPSPHRGNRRHRQRRKTWAGVAEDGGVFGVEEMVHRYVQGRHGTAPTSARSLPTWVMPWEPTPAARVRFDSVGVDPLIRTRCRWRAGLQVECRHFAGRGCLAHAASGLRRWVTTGIGRSMGMTIWGRSAAPCSWRSCCWRHWGLKA